MKTLFPQRLAVKNKSDLVRPIIKADAVEPYDDDETILRTIEECVDRIMMVLEINDCDEKVLISASRDNGLINLSINKETYRLEKGEWELLKA